MAENRTVVSQNDMYLSSTNATEERLDFDFLNIPLAWIIAVLLVSILGNSLVITAFFRDSRLKVIFNLFVVHLAAADIIISIIVILAVVDELTQISLLGTCTLLCQLCAICTNAIPVEQLILVHIMCHDRHRALQRGMSYTRSSFHWHIEKLVLFLTWVITLVGSFLMTDLMSSVKLFGYGFCKFPGRLLYMSYTSFLHFAMLVSLAVAVMCIAWDFRKQRKRQHFERLCVELEDGSPFLLSCKASASSQDSKQSWQSLIPRSPVQAFRSCLSLPSPGLRRPTCLPRTDLSAVLEVCEDVLKPNMRLPRVPYLKGPTPVDALPACSYAEIPPEALRFSWYGVQGAGNHEELSVVDLDEDLMNVGGQYIDDQHTCGDKYMMWKWYDRKFQCEPTLYDTDTAWLHGAGCPYDTAHELGQEPELYGTEDRCVEKLWPLHEESRCRDSGSASSADSGGAEGKPVAKKPVVNRGKYEHWQENQEEQAALEGSEGTDERAFAESIEDFLPASVSLSDDELADIPQLHLRPRTDSLYTLRSCLSVSEESLSKTLDEFMDVSTQSEASASIGMSEVGFKTRKEKRNENRLFTIGDEEEEQSDVKTICDMKSLSDVSSRTFPINTLPEDVPVTLIHCPGGASSHLVNLSGKGSSFRPVPKLIGENGNADTEKHHSTSKDLSAGECSEACPSSDILMVATATNGNSIVQKEFAVMPFVQSDPDCDIYAVDNKVDTRLQFPCNENSTRNKVDQKLPEQTLQISQQVEIQLEIMHPHEEPESSEEDQDSQKNNVDGWLQFPNDENTTRNKVDQQLPKQTLQISQQVEIQLQTMHPHEEPESSEEDQDSRKNNNDNEDTNNNAGNRKASDKNVKSHNLEKQENTISHTAACPVSGDSVYIPVALLNSHERTKETVLSAKTRQLTNQKCISNKSITADCMERLTSEEKDHVKFRSGKMKYKYESVSGDNTSYVRAKGKKDSKFYIGSLTYDMNYFGVFSESSSEYVDAGHSQRDIEIAVESWLKFYDINPTGQFRRGECEIAHGRKLLDKCSTSQPCKSFIPQPGHSMMCNSLVRARQIWLDFYGINTVEKNVPIAVSQQPGCHRLSVPVEVHAAGDDSCGGSVIGGQADEHLEWKSLKQGPLSDPAQVGEVKVGKRLKRGIKYQNERAGASVCEVPAVLGSNVCGTELEEIPEDCKQNSDTADNQQGNTGEESLHKFVSGYQGIGSNTAGPGDVALQKESLDTLQPSNVVNQAVVEVDLPTLPSHRHKMICEGLEDNSDVSMERSLFLQNTEVSSNPDIDCTLVVSFPKRQAVHCAEVSSNPDIDCTPVVSFPERQAVHCAEMSSNPDIDCTPGVSFPVRQAVHCAEVSSNPDIYCTPVVSFPRRQAVHCAEVSSNPDIFCTPVVSFPVRQAVHCAEDASILENTSKPSSGQASVFSCVFPLENGAGAFECYSKELNDQIEENPRVDYISGKELVVNNGAVAKAQVGLREIYELEKSRPPGEISLVKICSKHHKDQMRPTEQAHRKCLVDISRSSDVKNDISLLDRAMAQGNKPGEIDDHFIKSKSRDSYEQEAGGVITSGQAFDITEPAATTYQILESLSITCRAFLAELGIYQDILEGAIPLDQEMIGQKERKWMTPCPDCERRQQEKLRKWSGLVPGSARGSGAGCLGGSGAGQNGDTSGNAAADAQANNSTGLHHLTIDELRMEQTSALESEVSSLHFDMFHDLEEADVIRSSASASRAELFIRMMRRLPGMMHVMSRKCSIGELKGRDPELCIMFSLVCIVVLQLLCWLPIVTLYMVYDATEFPPTPSFTEVVFLWLWCSRMAIQPVLYAIFSKYFYQNYIELILCRRCR